jgi:hypothetical protein
MDKFTQQYIESALWTSIDDDGEAMDASYNLSDLAPETLKAMEADCVAFQKQAGEMLDENPEMSAHDFWLTRNGHGAGFWDGDWPINGERLTELSKEFGEVDLYVGDNWLIYS